MTKVVIKCVGLAGVAVNPEANVPVGAFLADFDADAHDGMGHATWTSDRALALEFDSAIAAFSFWKTQSTVRPKRRDGHPNRPLTAFSVEIV